MKILAPLIDTPLTPCQDVSPYIEEDLKWENGSMDKLTLPDASFARLDAMGCHFNGCILPQSDFNRAALRHIRFEGCDLTGANFEGASFHRVEFVRCRLTGANLPDCFFQDVTFSDCQLSFLNLSNARFKKCQFSKCKLDNAHFSDCAMNVAFSACDLTSALFHHSALKGIDLTDCNINGINIDIPDVRGVVVSTLQAAQLATIMGVVIRDDYS